MCIIYKDACDYLVSCHRGFFSSPDIDFFLTLHHSLYVRKKEPEFMFDKLHNGNTEALP